MEGKSIREKLNILENFKNNRKRTLVEKFKTQFVYGHREILLRYSGIDDSALLTGILQHGVGPTFTLYSDWPTPRVNLIKRSPLWVYSQVAAKDLSLRGVENIKAIGSPWLYSKTLDCFLTPESSSKEKYLVFPEHYPTSAKHNTAEITREKIKFWRSIAGGADLEICLFWSEFTDPIWTKIAGEEGVSLNCAGHPNSPLADLQIWSGEDARIDYYKNLRNIISSATHCIFETFTSAMFYASDLGRYVGFFPTETKTRIEPIYRTIQEQERNWLEDNLPQILRNFAVGNSLTQISRELLGYEDLLNPKELSSVLSFRKDILD
jgi:hypothetical protein